MKPISASSSSFMEPMQALLVEKLPEGARLYEVKFDGYRALAFKEGEDVRLISRNKKAFDYRQLLDGLKLLPAEHVILNEALRQLDQRSTTRKITERQSDYFFSSSAAAVASSQARGLPAK
jgi:ATP-dependent DNA ligase